MSDLQFNINEYGYQINRSLNESVAAASAVELVCFRGDVEKTLTGTLSSDTVVNFLVPDGFFDTPGIWTAKVRATFSGRVSEEKEPLLHIEITI